MSVNRRQFLHHCGAALLASTMPRARSESSEGVLRIGTFYGYDKNLAIKQFEQQYNVRTEFVVFENTDEITAELVRDTNKLDIAISSHFMLPHLVTLGLLQPLKPHWLSQLDRNALDKRFADSAMVNGQWYAWPNDWGTTGIVYYRSKVKFEPRSWQDFFKLIGEHKKKVSVPDDQTTVIGTALKTLGYSFNDTHPAHLLDSARLLRSVRNDIRSIDSDTDETMKRDVLGMGWSDTAYALNQENEDVQYVLPPEGGELWSDWYGITSRCHDVRLAHEFLNFFFTPSRVVENVVENGTSPVDERVITLLPKDLRENSILFPSSNTLRNMEMSSQASLREPLRGELFAQFKQNKWAD